jgi:tetratricopeptide (TPR) repeat protein
LRYLFDNDGLSERLDAACIVILGGWMTLVNQYRPVGRPFSTHHTLPSIGFQSLIAILLGIMMLTIFPGCSFKPMGGTLESTETYEVVLDDSSTSAGDFNNRGVIRMQDGDIKGAIADFLEAVERNPKEAGYLENLAWAQAGAGQFADAAKTLGQAIAIRPNDPELYWKRGTIAGRMGNHPAAVDDFTQALSIDPKLAKAYRDRGWSRVILRDWKASIADSTEAIKLTPGDALAYENRAAALAGAGDWKAAVEDYTRALDRNPHDHELYVMRADARTNANDLSGASADLDRAIQIHPDSARAYRLRGQIKQRLGDERGAEDDFQKAKALEGASADRPS